MIDGLNNLAWRLKPLKGFTLVSGLAFLVFFGYLLATEGASQDSYILPALAGLLWSACSYAFIVNFQHVPQRLDKSAPLFSRIKVRLRRFGFWLLALFFVGGTLTILWMTLRLIYIWVGR